MKNRCTIPRIDDLLDAVSGSQYFTSLDLTSGYHQILISEEDRPKTAFRTPFGHFQFKVLIEGLKRRRSVRQPLVPCSSGFESKAGHNGSLPTSRRKMCGSGRRMLSG